MTLLVYGLSGENKSMEYPKLIHTSDLHLNEDRPETIDALEKILDLADKHEVDLVTIAGDVFDTVEDAEALRPLLRSKFSGLGFEVIAIPGNHDLEAYSRNLSFGSNLTLVTGEPYKVLKRKDTSIVAVPYVNRPDEELLQLLKEEARNNESCVLMLHCTLDIGYFSGDFGDETRYFPISKSVIDSLGFDHVLAGHFHRDTQIRKLQGEGYFIYPGSPVSHSTNEQGKRSVVLIEDWSKPVEITLPTFYYDYGDFVVTPGVEDAVLDEISEWYKARCRDNCSLKVCVDGYTSLDENELTESITNVCENAEHELSFRGVTEVVNHPLYRGFLEKLGEKEVDREDRVRQFVMEAMARLLRTREIRG